MRRPVALLSMIERAPASCERKRRKSPFGSAPTRTVSQLHNLPLARKGACAVFPPSRLHARTPDPRVLPGVREHVLGRVPRERIGRRAAADGEDVRLGQGRDVVLRGV